MTGEVTHRLAVAATLAVYLLALATAVELYTRLVTNLQSPLVQPLAGASLALLVYAFAKLLSIVRYYLRWRAQEELIAERVAGWVRHYHRHAPTSRLDRASREGLSRLCLVTGGEDGRQLAKLYARHGFLRSDLEALKSRSRGRRSGALDRLSRVGHPAALPSLQNLVQSAPHTVAVEALRAIASVVRRAKHRRFCLEQLMKALNTRSFRTAEVQSALVLLGDGAADIVRHLLLTGDAHVIAALNAVGLIPVSSAFDLLTPYLEPRRPKAARLAAVNAVSRVGLATPAAWEAIRSGLASPDSEVRLAGVRATVALPPADSVSSLTPLLEDEDPRVRSTSAATLVTIGGAGAAAVAKLAPAFSLGLTPNSTGIPEA